MAQVMKGNRQITINEDKIEEFLIMGYSLIDEKGDIIKAGNAVTFKDLKVENETLKTELAKLKESNLNSEEIEALRAENESLKKDIKKLSKTE